MHVRWPDRRGLVGRSGPPRWTEDPAGAGTSDLIDWTEDPAIAAIVASWPASVQTARAARLGLTADQTFDDIVRDYLAGT